MMKTPEVREILCVDGLYHDYMLHYPDPGGWGRVIVVCNRCGIMPDNAVKAYKNAEKAYENAVKDFEEKPAEQSLTRPEEPLAYNSIVRAYTVGSLWERSFIRTNQSCWYDGIRNYDWAELKKPVVTNFEQRPTV